MKRTLCLSVSLLFALFSTQAGAGPLGIDLNTDTPETLGCTATKAKGALYECDRAAIPNPLPEFDGYSLVWREGVGICQISATGDTGDVIELGDEYAQLLTKKYGAPMVDSGLPIWRGEDTGVSISVVLFPLAPLGKLKLTYWIDENVRSCAMTDAEKQDSL